MSEQEGITYEYFNWGPLVCKYQTDLVACEKLQALGAKRSENDYRGDLAGHLDHEYGFTMSDRDWFVKKFGKYTDSYAQAYRDRYGTDHGGFDLTSLWINFMKAGDFNPPHMHTQDVSFILFTSESEELIKEQEAFRGTGPEPGNVIFTYGENSYKFAPQWIILNHYQRPKKGDFYIFPALLKHWVAPFKSDITRVSVSGNLRFRNRKDGDEY